MNSILCISLGASAGASLRWLISEKINLLHDKLPLGTLVANLLGALLIGIFFEYSSTNIISEKTRLAIVVGFLGSLTTFSSFSLETWLLLTKGDWTWAIIHPFIHFTGCMCMLAIGAGIGRQLA